MRRAQPRARLGARPRVLSATALAVLLTSLAGAPALLPVGSHGAPPDTTSSWDARRADDCTPPARRGHPLRVLFVGDSMTQGRSGSATYRYWVWRGLRDSGVPATFVGPRDRLSRTPDDVATEDSYEHLGHGFARQLRHAGSSGATFLTHPDPPAGLARRERPDVVVLQLGFNDANSAAATPTEIARRTRSFVEAVWRVDRRAGERPTRFVLGQIPPTLRGDPQEVAERNTRTRRANAAIRDDLAEPCLVEVNDLRVADDPAWDPRLHAYDGAHPNAVGETLMAQRALEALDRLGVAGLSGVDVHDPDEAWDPRPRLVAEQRGPRTWALSWAGEPARTGADRIGLVVQRPGADRPRFSGWLSGTSTVRVVDPGTTVAAVVQRGDTPGRMRSLPGPRLLLR